MQSLSKNHKRGAPYQPAVRKSLLGITLARHSADWRMRWDRPDAVAKKDFWTVVGADAAFLKRKFIASERTRSFLP
jgi:hypothetical protein